MVFRSAKRLTEIHEQIETSGSFVKADIEKTLPRTCLAKMQCVLS